MKKLLARFPSRKDRAKLGVAVACLAAIAIIIISHMFPPTLVGTANSLRTDWKHGNIETAYRLAPSWQKDQLQLTTLQLETIQQNFVQPILKKVRFLSDTKTEVDPGTGFCRAYFYAQLGTLPKMEFYVSSMLTQNGVTDDFAQYFYQLWEFEYILSHKGPLPKDWGFACLYEGEINDQKLLTSLGLNGLPGAFGSTHIQTWEQIIAYQKGLIQKYHLAL